MPYYVYVLLCEDGSYYTGYAKNVKRRVRQHNKGQGARYTGMHKPEKIVYVEEFNSRSEAMKREREIKSFSHKKKHRLANLYERSRSTDRSLDS
ncbi:GIY-YIG nuclease family protein [Candidatus Bathyarchaeota archaeon]|nr:GIY-YIG nuclease family protein [Candidatus Bathyarchaeota archaeon]